jgi:DNA-binding NarL/FixJ family response regulator
MRAMCPTRSGSERALESPRRHRRRSSTREQLVSAAETLVRIRRRHARDPARAVAAWKGLVDARWSLVDWFDSDGSSYLLAHRNDGPLAPLELLTERERQVVALAALGLANKMIAYELGIATSRDASPNDRESVVRAR